jgi:hypothetical protein
LSRSPQPHLSSWWLWVQLYILNPTAPDLTPTIVSVKEVPDY